MGAELNRPKQLQLGRRPRWRLATIAGMNKKQKREGAERAPPRSERQQ
jgi:hypothetical protein